MKRDNITIKLNSFGQAKYLNDCILHEIRNGNDKITVNLADSFSGCNVCAPIAGIIDYHRVNGIKIHVDCPVSSYAHHVRIYNPIAAEEFKTESSPFDMVLSFSSEEDVYKIVNMYSLALRKFDELENGVIQSLEWCMNEAIDNVLQHAKVSKGFVMAQVQRQSKLFSFCVFDYGIGIYNSLRATKHKPTTPINAIQLAMKERITRDETVGQGNGLWGLSQIIKETKGRLLLSSGGASYKYENDRETIVQSGDFNLGSVNGTTMIDFQLSYGHPIDIAHALNGYDPEDLWLNNHENEKGDIVFDVFKESDGTGTRKSAEKMRNIVTNAFKQGYSNIDLDFSKVTMLSSSYADELVGKLIASLGFTNFMQHISLHNLNEFNSLIVNRSVGQRMAQVYFDEIIREDEEL